MEGETCLIITGGNLNLDFAEQFLKHRSYGCVIAVDGGLEAAAALGVCPDEIVGELPVSKQEMIEIAKALSINAKILIMDEPTSALTSREIDELFNICLLYTSRCV